MRHSPRRTCRAANQIPPTQNKSLLQLGQSKKQHRKQNRHTDQLFFSAAVAGHLVVCRVLWWFVFAHLVLDVCSVVGIPMEEEVIEEENEDNTVSLLVSSLPPLL